MTLETIKTQTTWNDAAASINSNFATVNQEVETLKASGKSTGGSVSEIDTLLTQMQAKPQCKKINSTYNTTDIAKLGTIEITHPILEALEKNTADSFPLKNVHICLMRYVKRVGKSTAKNKKGWVQCHEKINEGLDWDRISKGSGYFVPIDGVIVKSNLHDMLQFVLRNYLCVVGYTRSTLKTSALTTILATKKDMWFGNNVSVMPAYSKKKAHFGFAIRCDNPDFPTTITDVSTTRYKGANRYIYSDVYDILVDTTNSTLGVLGTTFLG